MNITFRMVFLFALFSMHIKIGSTNLPSVHLSALYKETILSIKDTALTSAKLAVAATAATALCYYLLLPAATQTASTIGTAMVHETARVTEMVVEQTAPFGAGGFLVHYLMNELGIQSHQGMERVYAASFALYLMRRQVFMTLGI